MSELNITVHRKSARFIILINALASALHLCTHVMKTLYKRPVNCTVQHTVKLYTMESYASETESVQLVDTADLLSDVLQNAEETSDQLMHYIATGAIEETDDANTSAVHSEHVGVPVRVTFIKNQKGQLSAECDGFVYWFNKSSRDNLKWFWRCANRSIRDGGCMAIITTDTDGIVVDCRKSEHNHEPEPWRIEQIKTMASVRDEGLACTNDPSAVVNAVVTPRVAPVLANELNLKPAVRYVRNKNNRANPRSAAEIQVDEQYTPCGGTYKITDLLQCI